MALGAVVTHGHAGLLRRENAVAARARANFVYPGVTHDAEHPAFELQLRLPLVVPQQSSLDCELHQVVGVVHIAGDGAREAAQSRQQLDDLTAHLLHLTHIYGWTRLFLPTGVEDCTGGYRIVYGGCSTCDSYHCAWCSASPGRRSGRSCRRCRCRTCRGCPRISSTAPSTTPSTARCARPTRSSCAKCGACEFASCCGPIAPGSKRTHGARRWYAAKSSLFRLRPRRSTVRGLRDSLSGGRARSTGSMPRSSFCRRPQGCRLAARCRDCVSSIP